MAGNRLVGHHLNNVMLVTKFLGIFPTQILSGKSRFIWKFSNLMYSLFIYLVICFGFISYSTSAYFQGFNIWAFKYAIEHGGAFLVASFFLYLSKSKLDMFTKFNSIDELLIRKLNLTMAESSTSITIKFLIFSFLVVSNVEYSINILNRYRGCHLIVYAFNLTGDEADCTYFLHRDLFWFYRVESRTVTWFAEVSRYFAILLLQWPLVFLSCINVCLRTRFRQINTKISSMTNEYYTEISWKNVRFCYNELVSLARYLNRELSFLIAETFVANVLYLLVQYSFMFHPKYELFTIQIIFSLIQTFARISTTVYFLDGIRAESGKTADLIARCELDKHNRYEIELLYWQATFDDVSFSVLDCVRIDKNFVTKIVAGLITFQIIILQFNSQFPEFEETTTNSSMEQVDLRKSRLIHGN